VQEKAVASSYQAQFARDARARAASARAEARDAAERAWQKRCAAVGLIMRARELGPPLQLQIPPDVFELRNVRERVRMCARAHGADAEAVVLAAHEAVAHVLTGRDASTDPIHVVLGIHHGVLELRVEARSFPPLVDWLPHDSPTSLRLIGELADEFEVRPLGRSGIEIIARFATSGP
jgi:hypothetical protein